MVAKRSGSAGSLSEANGVAEVDGQVPLPVMAGGVPNQLRRDTTEGVRKALERGRKTVCVLSEHLRGVSIAARLQGCCCIFEIECASIVGLASRKARRRRRTVVR
jgi:hypothetical protein